MEKFIEEYKIAYANTYPYDDFDLIDFTCGDIKEFYLYLTDCSVEEYVERRYDEVVETFEITRSYIQITVDKITNAILSLEFLIDAVINNEEWDLSMLYEVPLEEDIEDAAKEMIKLVPLKDA